VGLLDGQIAETFAAVFGGIYLSGSLYRPNAYTDDGTGGGDGSGFAASEAIRVQVDAATQAMRASEGFVDGDVRILVLAHGVTTIDTDCELATGGTRYMIASVAVDSAGSYYELRGRPKKTV